MSYSEILENLMDRVDRDAFVAEVRRRVGDVQKWVDLEDVA